MTTTRKRKSKTQSADTSATDYKSEYWKMADALRGSMDAAEYKHVVLGLIFLKYISDAFEEAYVQSSNWSRTRALTPRTRTSTEPRASSGCRPRHGGSI